jgi:hypothetical protein
MAAKKKKTKKSVYQQIRKPLPQPTVAFPSKKKYRRKPGLLDDENP